MSTARLHVVCFMFFFAILSIQQCICADSPGNSPSPAPESGGDLGSLPPIAAAPKTPSPSPSPLASVSSPPASPPTYRSSNSVSAPSPVTGDDATPSPITEPSSPSPAPTDVVASDIRHESTTTEVASLDGEMNGGKKAGVAFGVLAAVCVVGLGALVYKKRRQNIRRAQFGIREFLGMNGGKEAGEAFDVASEVAFGVLAAAFVVCFGAVVCKKSRQNIRRAQFGYAAPGAQFGYAARRNFL